MIMTEYNEDNMEDDEDGIFVISQKFQEIAQQGLDRFVQLSIFYFCELPLCIYDPKKMIHFFKE